MARTKTKDRILLSNGMTVTLGSALDMGLVALEVVVEYSRTKEDSAGRALKVERYIAREVGGDRRFWDVGKTLYQTRKGGVFSP